MAYLAMSHWGWLTASFLLGLAMGRDRGGASRTQRLQGDGVLACPCGRSVVALAVSRVVPGRSGYWLDLGLVLFACYLIGCAIGSRLRSGWCRGRQRSLRPSITVAYLL